MHFLFLSTLGRHDVMQLPIANVVLAPGKQAKDKLRRDNSLGLLKNSPLPIFEKARERGIR